MSTRWGLVALAVAALATTPAVVGQKPTTPSTTFTANQVVMFQEGQALLNSLPASVKNGTPIDKAKYAFTHYCNTLAKNHIPVNSTPWTRLQNTFGNFDPGRWTCGDHTANLGALFEGMGIKQPIEIEASTGNMPAGTPNPNHGSAAIVYGGKLYVFDAWQLAFSGDGTYAGAVTSKWNGMELADWEAEMSKQLYVLFSRDGSHYFKTLYDAVKDLGVDQPPVTPPNPGTSVGTTPPDTKPATTACEKSCKASYDRSVGAADSKLQKKGYWSGLMATNCGSIWNSTRNACWEAYSECGGKCDLGLYDPKCKKPCFEAFQPCCHANEMANAKHYLDLCLAACPR
jgi:hypothetical protein